MLTKLQQEAIDAVQEHGSKRAAAKALDINIKTLYDRLKYADRKEAQTAVVAATAKMSEYGYDVEQPERTPAQAWTEHVGAFQRKVSRTLDKAERTIHRSGPFVIFHATDEHVDDDASALNVLAADIEASHQMGAIMCHGGDLLNNWPIAGKLAKMWAEQSCTLPDALLRAQHFVDIFKPDVWVDGNHEEMNPYLINLFYQWIPKATIRDYWRADFTVKTPGGRDFRAALSHKFQKGNSWFHALHGPIREMLQSEERDLYMDGHYHQAGIMHHTLSERRHSALLVASAGYKLVDKWATRISRGGKDPSLVGRAHWVVVDPYADDASEMSQAFKSPEHAEAYLNTLQNLRAA